MSYQIELSFNQILENKVLKFLEFLIQNEKYSQKFNFQINKTNCTFQIESINDLKIFCNQIWFYYHPFDSIKINNKQISQENTFQKEYLLYNQNEEIKQKPLIDLLILSLISNSNFEDSLKIIDPISNLKTLPIDLTLAINKVPQRINQKGNFPKEFEFQLSLPKTPKKSTHTISAITQDQQLFKQIREETIKARVKLKQSQFELDWLDVKYEKQVFNYTISYLDITEQFSKFINEYLYQAEFITKEKIIIITKKMIQKRILRKHKLSLIEEYKFEHLDKKYYLYILK